MEDYEEYEEGGSPVNKVLIAVIVLLLLAIAAGCVYFFFIRKEPEEDGLGFGVGVALTQEELDAAMEDAARNAAGGAVALKYKNGAYSDDGTNFDCYILNSESNLYDMFFEIYADEELTDKIFASGLIPRGSGYNNQTNANQVIVNPESPITKKGIATMTKADVDGKPQAGSYVLYRLGGNCSEEPEVAWKTTDKFDVKVAFSFTPVAP